VDSSWLARLVGGLGNGIGGFNVHNSGLVAWRSDLKTQKAAQRLYGFLAQPGVFAKFEFWLGGAQA
jgi:hypothetical protein